MIGLGNKKGTILIVDAKKENNFKLSRILRKEGYWVETTHDFTHAMDMLREKEIDIVLTEVELPDSNGIALLKEIKKEKPQVQVVIITDNGSFDSYLKVMELGAFEYFNKPVKNIIMCKAIEKALKVSP